MPCRDDIRDAPTSPPIGERVTSHVAASALVRVHASHSTSSQTTMVPATTARVVLRSTTSAIRPGAIPVPGLRAMRSIARTEHPCARRWPSGGSGAPRGDGLSPQLPALSLRFPERRRPRGCPATMRRTRQARARTAGQVQASSDRASDASRSWMPRAPRPRWRAPCLACGRTSRPERRMPGASDSIARRFASTNGPGSSTRSGTAPAWSTAAQIASTAAATSIKITHPGGQEHRTTATSQVDQEWQVGQLARSRP